MNKSKAIGAAISARLAAISVANGYLTDVGARVFRGRRRIDLETIPCATLIEGSDNVQDQTSRQVKVMQRYIVEAHAQCDADNPNDKAHDIIADLKRALFAGDRTYDGLFKSMRYVGRTIGAREDGEAIVFASIEVDAEVTEDLFDPAA